MAPESIAVKGNTLSATLKNQHEGVDLPLTLKAYADGFVRFTVDEAPEVGR